MTEITLDEFGIPLKTGKEPIDGIKKGTHILKKFSDEYGPVSEYKSFLKKHGSSNAYATFEKDYEWLQNHLERIADYMYKELGEDKINMSAYFIELKGEDHDCVQINFPYENTVLKYHFHGPNFAQYLTSTISEDINKIKKDDLMETYFTKLLDSIPECQLKYLNWVEPKFISNYALDADPHLVLQMEFDYEGIKQDKSGVYADLFVQEKRQFPFFPFQPVFGGKKKETAVIILPREELFDIDDFRQKMANRINIKSNDINIDKQYNFKIATDELKNSVCFRTAHEIRVKYKDADEISDYANDFMRQTKQGLRGAQKCVASDFVKGKNEKEMEKGLCDRLLNSYKCPTYVNLTFATFGPPEDHMYFDEDFRLKLIKKFKEYKQKKLTK